MFPQVSSHIAPAATALSAGYVVLSGTSTTALVSGGADQAACQRLPITGITVSAAEAGERPAVAISGGDIPYVSAGATAVGDLLVAKFGTGALMAVTSHLTGDIIVGVCTYAAADGATGLMRFVGHPTK